MTQILSPPPPSSAKKKRTASPALWVWFWSNADTRSVKIGVLATILVHLLLLLIAPHLLTPEKIVPYQRRRGAPIRIHLTVPKVPPRQRPLATPPQHYVEANPNAPENKPDHTNNFSDRNQQAAQEHPTAKSRSDRPTLKGRKDIQSNQIVNGRLVPPQPITPPTPKATKAVVKKNATPKREQNPLSGTEKDIGRSRTGFGTDIAKAENNKPIPNRIKGSSEAPLLQMSPFTTPAIDPNHPRQRPTLDVYARPAIFADNPVGTSNLGITGIDARWSNYGVYLKRMLEIVQAEFDKVVDESQIYPPPGSEVRVTFKLTSQGKISQIVTVTKSPSCTDPAEQNCVISITTPAPYDPWSDDMIAMLGTEQQMTFIFYYQ